jgi:hypothetical protein
MELWEYNFDCFKMLYKAAFFFFSKQLELFMSNILVS